MDVSAETESAIDSGNSLVREPIDVQYHHSHDEQKREAVELHQRRILPASSPNRWQLRDTKN